MESHVFGPVPSRRLGFSLGVDVVPAKTCSFNCVYCQVGRTTAHTARRRVFFNTGEILADIRQALRRRRKLDYITFSGSGEPTLASNIGEMIRGVKDLTDVPVAVITNSSLISRGTVQRDLLPVDLLVPSLDAAGPVALRKVNRPCRGIRVADIIQGLADFRARFRGRMWLEVMLVRGLNDGAGDIDVLREAIARIAPDRVQLNTVFRPPCEAYAGPLAKAAMARIARQIGGDIPVEIIAPFKGRMDGQLQARQTDVLGLLKRRACTIEDIASALGINRAEAIKHAEYLASTGSAATHRQGNRLYYSVLP